MPVTFMVDGCQQWVKNIQRAAYIIGTGGSPSLLTTNVPKAKVTGVEFQGSIKARRVADARLVGRLYPCALHQWAG